VWFQANRIFSQLASDLWFLPLSEPWNSIGKL
jgi:hypothetical protein